MTGVALRPLREDEFGTFRAESEAGYARDLEVNGGMPRDAARRKAEADFTSLLADGVSSPGHHLFVVEEAGRPVGTLWLAEREGDGRRMMFVYGVEIDERLRGRGLGRTAMTLAEAETRRRGLARLELNVFGGNEVARGLYRSLGYRELAVYMGKDL